METNYRIISAKDFIKAKASGELDREESIKLLIEIATLIESPSAYDIFLDVRQAYGDLTLFDIYEFVEELGRHRDAFRNKIAVLSREGLQLDNTKFMELCAKNRGLQVGVFTDFEQTIDWLTTSTDIDQHFSSKQ